MFKPEKSQIESARESQESLDISIFPPANETLLNPKTTDSAWPEDIKNNEKLEMEAENRRQLLSQLDSLFSKIPKADMEISEAIDAGLTDADQTAALYGQLSDFLKDKPSNARIILYLPFELLPSKSWRPESEALKQAADGFSKSYLEGWEELLSVHDVRANFLDGDISETEVDASNLPRVSKAAHLAPVLVKKRLVSSEKIISLIEDNQSDRILRDSLADTIPVLADMELLSNQDRQRMADSTDSLLRNLAIIINDDSAENRETVEPGTALPEDAKRWLNDLSSDIKRDLLDIENNRLKRLAEVPETRVKWERQAAENALIEGYSKKLASALGQGAIGLTDLQEIIISSDNLATVLAGINGLRKNMENSATNDLEKAKTDYAKFEPLFLGLWANAKPEIRDALESAWSRLSSLGVISTAYVSRLDLNPSKPEMPFAIKKQENLQEMSELAAIARSIETDEKLAKYLYPAAIMYGSKIKGYGTKNADTDIAVFIRPETPVNERPEVKKLLAQTFSNDQIKGQALEFWLEKAGGELKIKDFPGSDLLLGDSSLAHVLFNGAWCGQTASIKELHEKLLSGYLHSKGKKINGYDARSIWLEELERDTLQYRLMHKGYQRFYPEQGGLRTKHSDTIDPSSAFWDSGYRRLAAKLFISKVFLPQLEK